MDEATVMVTIKWVLTSLIVIGDWIFSKLIVKTDCSNLAEYSLPGVEIVLLKQNVESIVSQRM